MHRMFICLIVSVDAFSGLSRLDVESTCTEEQDQAGSAGCTCIPGGSYNGVKGFQCPTVNLNKLQLLNTAQSKAGHFKTAWLPTEVNKGYDVGKCKEASCTGGTGGKNVVVPKGGLFFAEKGAKLPYPHGMGAKLQEATANVVKLVTFDFDGTTELYDQLAHDVIDEAQRLLDTTPPACPMPSQADIVVHSSKKTCRFCAKIPSTELSPEDWKEKNCEKVECKTDDKVPVVQTESTCLGTKACRKTEGCVQSLGDNMITAFKTLSSDLEGDQPGVQGFIDRYFNPGYVVEEVPLSQPDSGSKRWAAYLEHLKGLQKGVLVHDEQETKELWWLSASWSPVPGAAWGMYLKALVQHLDTSSNDIKLFTPSAKGSAAPLFSGISGIDDPGPGLAADKGKELKNICTGVAGGLDSAGQIQTWYTPAATLSTQGEKEAFRSSKYDIGTCWHVDNGEKYAMQAAGVGAGGMHVWGAGVSDLSFLGNFGGGKKTAAGLVGAEFAGCIDHLYLAPYAPQSVLSPHPEFNPGLAHQWVTCSKCQNKK